MSDPSLCLRPPELWTVLTSALMQWLSEPLLVVLPLALLIALPWFIRPLPFKRWLSAVPAVVLLAYIGCTAPPLLAFANRRLMHFEAAGTAIPADAIVVLGRGIEFQATRVDLAAQLWQAGRAPRIFTSGRGDADSMLAALRAKGVPASDLQAEECSRTTEENAQFTALRLKPEGVRRIVLITDAPHMMRSLDIFQKAGFAVVPAMSPIPPQLSEQHKRLLILREFAGWLLYRLSG